MKGFMLYKIYYGNNLIYLGRTKQDLQQRIRGHFFAKPMHRKIDIFLTTKIEFAECATEADLYVYEVYYINKYHPPLNVDDRSHDNLTIELPDIEWRIFDCKLIDKWKSLLSEKENKNIYKRNYGAIQRVSEVLDLKKKQTEFEKKMIPIAKKKCERIHNLGSPIYNQYVYNGQTYFGLMGLYEYLSESNIIKKFPEQIIDSYYGIDS